MTTSSAKGLQMHSKKHRKPTNLVLCASKLSAALTLCCKPLISGLPLLASTDAKAASSSRVLRRSLPDVAIDPYEVLQKATHRRSPLCKQTIEDLPGKAEHA